MRRNWEFQTARTIASENNHKDASCTEQYISTDCIRLVPRVNSWLSQQIRSSLTFLLYQLGRWMGWNVYKLSKLLNPCASEEVLSSRWHVLWGTRIQYHCLQYVPCLPITVKGVSSIWSQSWNKIVCSIVLKPFGFFLWYNAFAGDFEESET